MERIVVGPDRFDRQIAQMLAGQVLRKPDSTLCLATGDTTAEIFRELVRLKQELDIDFSRIKAINLDEYVGVEKQDPASCYYRIHRDLYRPVGIAENRFYVPISTPENAEAECRRFAETLERFGGIDLMLMSIGGNGHIAFNEPGTPWDLGIHIAELTPSTVRSKTELFGGAEKVPRHGITMGVKTVMRARQILIAAKGAHKKEIIQAVLQGPVTPDVPGSVLQLHPNTLTVLDKAAAGVS